MAIIRIARGTANDKASGTDLTISGVTLPVGHSLVVGVSCENSQLAPSTVTHAGRLLNRRQQEDNVVQGYHTSAWVKGEYHKEKTGDIVAVWSSAIGERVMVASSYDLVQRKDDGSGKSETTTSTNPGTGLTGQLVAAGSLELGVWYRIAVLGTTDFTMIGASSNVVGEVFQATGAGVGTGTARKALESAETMVVCFFGANGPVEDHGSVTARIDDGGVWTPAAIGQKDGTTGGGAASNVTIVEAFLQLSERDPTRGQLQSATSRRWASVMLALQERRSAVNTQGITPSDVEEVEAIVVAAAGDPDDVYFGFNEGDGSWEAYETTTPGTLHATRDVLTGEWV